nr:9645_t:CDS:2 [Entrophospora candida]
MAQNYNSSEQFLEETSSIEHNINIIRKNIERIQVLQTRILVSTSIKQEDSDDKEREELMLNTRNILFDIKDRIRKIQYENAKLPIDDLNISLRKQRYEHLREKFGNLLEEYRRIEDVYMGQQKERTARQYKIVNLEATQEEIDSYLSSSSNQPLFQPALIRTGEARAAFEEVQKRHDCIKQIEKTIEELANLFRELHLQVEEQDSAIANIEESIEETLVNIKKSETVVDDAHGISVKHQARKRDWIPSDVFDVGQVSDDKQTEINSKDGEYGEYDGENGNLDTPEVIAKWIEERKKRYPTEANIARKRKLEEEKKAHGKLVSPPIISKVPDHKRVHCRNLREMLLYKETVKEKNVILQCLRYIVKKKFFGIATNRMLQEEKNKGGPEIVEMK